MDGLIKYWPIYSFAAANIFALGVMWWKVESARNAVKLLFEKAGELEKHTYKHCGEIDSVKETLKSLANSVATNVIRTDQIYTILTKKD